MAGNPYNTAADRVTEAGSKVRGKINVDLSRAFKKRPGSNQDVRNMAPRGVSDRRTNTRDA